MPVARPHRKKRASKAQCCFCAAYKPVSEMKEKPCELWDIGIPLVNDSSLSCRACLTKCRAHAGTTRRKHGLFAAPDLDSWPVRPASEFVFKMLCLAERPPVDAQGFYPGETSFANRPVTREDISAPGNEPLWRAGWTHIDPSGGRSTVGRGAGAKTKSTTGGVATPTDWAELKLDDLPDASALGDLWDIVNQRRIDNRELKRSKIIADANSLAKTNVRPTSNSLSASDEVAIRERPAVSFLDQFGFSQDTSGEMLAAVPASEISSLNTNDRIGDFPRLFESDNGDGDDETASFFEQMNANELPYLGPGAHEDARQLGTFAGRPVSSAGGAGRQDIFSSGIGERLAPIDDSLVRSDIAPSVLLGGRPDSRATRSSRPSSSHGGTTDGIKLESLGNRPASTPYSTVTPAMERKYSRKFGIGRGQAPILVRCHDMEPGKFFFPHHGALVATLIQLVRRNPMVRKWVIYALPGIANRALRVPLRSHTRASKASFYLLCTLASEFRSELSKLDVVKNVLWTLVGEEWLAASVLQLYWKRKHAATTAAARKEFERQQRLEAKAKKRAAMTPSERAAAEAKEAEEGNTEDDDEVPRNPFEARQEMISTFHRTHIVDQWGKMESDVRLLCDAKWRLWLGLGRGLLQADKHGKSDPYVIVLVDGEERYRTRIVDDSLDPIWNETASFNMSSSTVDMLQPVEIKFVLFDYDKVGKHDPLGTCTMTISLGDLEEDYTLETLPVMLDHRGFISQRGWLHVGICAEAGEELQKEVNLDMFRGSIKLMTLLTEPGKVPQSGRNSRFLAFNGALVPVLMGLTGEFADDDLRIQECVAQLLLNMAAVPAVRHKLLRAADEFISIADPSFQCTVKTRSLVLKVIGLIAIPYISDDEKGDPDTEANALSRSMTICSKLLANERALTVFRSLVLDILKPGEDGLCDSSKLIDAELAILADVFSIFVRITSYNLHPSPASDALGCLIAPLDVEKVVLPPTKQNYEEDKNVAPLQIPTQSVDGVPSTVRLHLDSLDSAATASETSMIRRHGHAGPFLLSSLCLLTEAEYGLDVLVVQLLTQVMEHNYERDDVTPLVIAIQGVSEKATRHELEHRIEAAGGQWREPDFQAERLQDILADDVTHLFEGQFISKNGRTKKESACFQDASSQGCIILKSMEDLDVVLDDHSAAMMAREPIAHVTAFDIDRRLSTLCQGLPDLISARVLMGASPHSPNDLFVKMLVYGQVKSKCSQSIEDAEVESLRLLVAYNEGLCRERGNRWLSSNPMAKRSVHCVYAWALTLAAHDHDDHSSNVTAADVRPLTLLHEICRAVHARCVPEIKNTTGTDRNANDTADSSPCAVAKDSDATGPAFGAERLAVVKNEVEIANIDSQEENLMTSIGKAARNTTDVEDGGEYVVRTTSMLGAIIALVASHAVNGIDKARAVIWLQSFSRVLASTAIGGKNVRAALLSPEDILRAQLLILHSAAKAIRDLPLYIHNRFVRFGVEPSVSIAEDIERVYKKRSGATFKKLKWWEDLKILLDGFKAAIWTLMEMSCGFDPADSNSRNVMRRYVQFLLSFADQSEEEEQRDKITIAESIELQKEQMEFYKNDFDEYGNVEEPESNKNLEGGELEQILKRDGYDDFTGTASRGNNDILSASSVRYTGAAQVLANVLESMHQISELARVVEVTFHETASPDSDGVSDVDSSKLFTRQQEAALAAECGKISLDVTKFLLVLLRHLALQLGTSENSRFTDAGAAGKLIPVLIEETILSACVMLVREGTIAIQDLTLSLLEDIVVLAPRTVVPVLADKCSTLEAFAEAASPDGMPGSFFFLVRVIAEHASQRQKFYAVPNAAVIFEAHHKKPKPQTPKGLHKVQQKSLATPIASYRELLPHLAQAPVLLRCILDRFLEFREPWNAAHEPQIFAEIMSFFTALVHRPVINNQFQAERAESDEVEGVKHTAHEAKCLCDHIIATEQVFRQTVQIIRRQRPSYLQDEDKYDPSGDSEMAVMHIRTRGIPESAAARNAMLESRKSFMKLTEGTLLEGGPDWEKTGFISFCSGFKSLGRKGAYGEIFRQAWAKELRRVAGASGKILQNGAARPLQIERAAPRDHNMDRSAQRILDESACRFLDSCLADHHHAELNAPTLVRVGVIEALAEVTKRWRGGPFETMKPGDETCDGRLAHHHAVNALVRLAQLSRGRYQEMIMVHGTAAHVALQDRLDAMAAFAKAKHSTNYKQQSTMAAIKNCIALSYVDKRTEQDFP